MTLETSPQDNPDAIEKIDKPTQGILFTDEEIMGFLNPIGNIEGKREKLQRLAKRRRFTYSITQAAQELEISPKALLQYHKEGMICKSTNKWRISFYYLDLVRFLKNYPTQNSSSDE